MSFANLLKSSLFGLVKLVSKVPSNVRLIAEDSPTKK